MFTLMILNKYVTLQRNVAIEIALSENPMVVSMLLKKRFRRETIEAIIKAGAIEFTMQLLKREHLNQSYQLAIVRTGNKKLISMLMMREFGDDAKLELIKSRSPFIGDLIKKGNLSDHHLAEIMKLGNPELNALLIEALSGDKDREFIVSVLKQGKPERIEVLIQFLEADQKEELEDAIVNIFRVFDAK
jgi:hypothetical protein